MPDLRGRADGGVMEVEEFMLAAEVALLLRLQVRTLTLWRKKGHGPPWVRLGPREVRYRKDDVMAWVASQTCGGQS